MDIIFQDKKMLEKIINDLTSLFESWLKDAGASKILMAILLSDKPLKQKDIAEKLDISVSTVSRNMKYILDFNPPLVIKTKVANSKEWQYERRDDTPYILLIGMILSFDNLLRSNIVPLEHALVYLNDLKPDDTQKQETERFKELLLNLFNASKVMQEELKKLMKNFQNQILGEKRLEKV